MKVKRFRKGCIKNMNNVTSGQLNSLRALMDNVIDYAGIFPPGNLPLEEAVRNYRRYLDDDDSWMLRSFVLPISKLNNLEQYMDLFSTDKKIRLSLIITKSNSVEEFDNVCKQDYQELVTFLEKYQDRAVVESFEVPLPTASPTEDVLNNVSKFAEAFHAIAFCEMTEPLSTVWIRNMNRTMDAIKKFNLKNPENELGYKLRTGGIKSELFPSIEQVAATLTRSTTDQIPIKFTAGLHHPIRMFRNEVQSKMHGFLNIFLGYIFQVSDGLNQNQLEKILSDESGVNFEFSDNEIKWRDYKVSSTCIHDIRSQLLSSFGSCSFDEPRDDLRSLNFVK